MKPDCGDETRWCNTINFGLIDSSKQVTLNRRVVKKTFIALPLFYLIIRGYDKDIKIHVQLKIKCRFQKKIKNTCVFSRHIASKFLIAIL